MISALALYLIQLTSPPVIVQTNNNWTIEYPSDYMRTNFQWHVEESRDLTNWFPLIYDESITNIPLVRMGQNTFIRLSGEPIQ